MSKQDELRPEYDLSKLKVAGQGLYADRYAGGVKFIVDGVEYVRLDPDVAKVFKTSEAVNEALRLVIKMSETVKVEAH